MYEGWLSFGCNEIVSSSRSYGYTQTAECPVTWLRMTYCDNLAPALGDEDYTVDNIDDAPWYDEQEPRSARFYGVYPITVEGLADSTRTATVIEGILDGGVIAGYRNAVRTLRVRAILIGEGQDALEYGMQWLDAALRPEDCGVHGATCGEVDLQFFLSCPPLPEDGESNESYEERVNERIRVLHGVVAISGPTVEQKLRRDNVFGYIVEFILAAATPYVYSLPKPIETVPTTPIIVQDAPVNLVPYPSAELGSGSVVVATNYSTNPGVFTNATDWATATAVITGADPAPYFTSGRDAVDINPSPSGGAGTMRARILGNGSTVVTNANSQASIYQQVSLVGLPATTRISFSIWAAALITQGAAGSAVNSITVVAQWRTGTTTLSETVIGSTTSVTDFSGRSYSLKSQPIPAGADNVRVIVRYNVRWSSSATAGQNSDLRMYADALAVSVP